MNTLNTHLQCATCTILLTLLSAAYLRAQSEGNIRLGVLTERTQYSDRDIQSYGLQAEWYLTDWLSLSYNFELGSNSQSGLYSRLPGGAWVAAYPFTAYVVTQDSDWLYAAVLALMTPEAINFHIRASDSFTISPYFAPFGMFYERTRNEQNPSFESGFTTGLRFNIFKGNFGFTPYVGARSLYRRGSNWGLVGGVTVGYSF